MPHAKKHFFVTHGGAGGVPWKKAENPYTEEPRQTIWELGEVNPTIMTPQMDTAGATLVEGWAFPQIRSVFDACKKNVGVSPGTPVCPPVGVPGTAPPPPGGQRIHIVKSGDWLSKIAITYYNDMSKTKLIYDTNRQTIGPNPDLIIPGQRLIIP